MKKLILFSLLVFVVGCSRTTVIKTHPADTPGQQANKGAIKSSDNHLEQGKKFYYTGKYTQATKHFIRAIARNDKNWEAYYYLGLTQQNQRRYNQSIASLKNCLKLAPRDAEIQAQVNFALGFSWEQNSAPDKASMHYILALDLHPGYTEAKAGLERIKKTKQVKKNTKKKKPRAF